MKKRVLSLFMAFVLCLTLLPTAAFAEGETSGSMSGNTTIGDSESGNTGGGVLVPDTPSGGGIYEDTRTEIWRDTTLYQSISRGYDGTTDGSTIKAIFPFTDGSEEIQLEEGKDCEAVKTFDSADAGSHTVSVELKLIGDAATKYKLKAGEEKFAIGGTINKAVPDLVVSISKTTCAVGEKLLPLLSVDGVQEDAAVTYYYTPIKSGYLEFEGSDAVPKIDENTAIDKLDENGNNTYYLYAKTAETQNYKEERSTTVELMVSEAAADAASVTKADGSDGGTFSSLPEALDAAQDGDTVTLLANHTTNMDVVDKGDESTLPIVTKTLTLDLNGKTVDHLNVGHATYLGNDADGNPQTTVTNGYLTIVDKSEGDAGSVTENLLLAGGTLNIQGGVIGDYIEGVPVGSLECESGTVTISGGTVLGLTLYGDTVIVTGGKGHAGTWLTEDGTLTITDGNFGNVSFETNNGSINISGGTFQRICNSNASASAPVMSLLADGYAFYGKDADEKYAVLQDSSKTTLKNVKVLAHTEHSFLNGACIACSALTCEKGACIAHVFWSKYADSPEWATYHIKTLDELQQKITDSNTWNAYNDPHTATVTFLTDVTVDQLFCIDKYWATIIFDLNGHTLTGNLDTPVIEAAAGILSSYSIDFKNGTIKNTGSGDALRITRGRVTLENLNVTGTLTLTSELVSSQNYSPTFLGGGTFTKICALNENGRTWYAAFERILPTGYYFEDLATGVRVSQDELSTEQPLVNVTVRPCNHKDESGRYTFVQSGHNAFCSTCGNLCLHEDRTQDDRMCIACDLKLDAIATTKRGDKIYYVTLSDAFNNDTKEGVLKPQCDQNCTQSSLTYLGSITIDLNDCRVTASDINGDLFAPNITDYTATFKNSGGGWGEYVCTALKVGRRNEWSNGTFSNDFGKLVIPATDNNLTISAVVFEGDGEANLAGGSFGKITVPEGKLLASLLVSGYYFADSTSGKPAALYGEDGTALTELTNVTVKACSHDTAICGSDGAWKCFCGQNTFVASITKDEATTCYTDLQEAFNAADGGTVKLLANVGDVTVNTDQPFFVLDLNGYNIYKLTVNSKITLKDSAETKGQITERLEVPVGMTIGELLEEGYAFKKSDGTWPSGAEQAVGNVCVQQVPILSVGLAALNAEDNTEVSTTMPYGTTGGVKLSASCNVRGTTAPDCKWYELGGSLIPIDDATGMNYLLPDDLTAGEHTYRVTFTLDGYSRSAEITITVTPISLAGATVAVGELTYNGEAQTPAVTVKLGEKVLVKDTDYTLTDAEQTNAGSYQLTVTGKGGYEGKIENVDWKIEPKTVTNPSINVAPCGVYDRYEKKPLVELKDGETVIPKEEYTVEYSDNVNAGTGIVTIKDKDGGNYVVSGSATFPIEQASINTSNRWIEVRVFNELAKTYEVELQPNLDNILYEQRIDGEFGTVTYSLDENGASTYEDYYELGTAKIENGKLILPIKNGSGVPSGNYIVTLMLRVESTNFKSFDLPIHIVARDKIVPMLAKGSTVSATSITYGQTLNESTLTVDGTMQAPSIDAPNTIQGIRGSFAWKDGTIKPNAGSCEAEWTFTPAAGYEEYAPATGTVTVRVNKATMTASAEQGIALTYDGTQRSAAVTTTTRTVDDTPAQFTYAAVESGPYGTEVPAFTDAGSYTVYFRAEDFYKNHEVVLGSFTVTILSKTVTNPTIELSGASFTYTGEKIEPTVIVKDGEMVIPAEEYTVSYTGNTNVGDATVTITDKEGGNYVVSGSTTFQIIKADSSVTAAPKANENLVYNGTEQVLITVGTAANGTMVYSLEENGEYAESIPAGKNAGIYTVWYKVVGDSNHNNTTAQSMEVTIKQAAVTVTAKGKSAYVGETTPALPAEPVKDTDYTISGLFGEDTLEGTVTLTYDGTPDMSKVGEATIKISGTLKNDNYAVTYVDGKLIISTRPSSGGGGGGSTTTKTETTTNPDGSVTKTETKSDGTVIETTTNPDGSTSKTESKTTTKSDGTTVETATETNTGADGSKSTSKTETTTNPDGSKTETKSETKTEADGTKSETKSETKTDANGVTSGTETTKTTTPDGSTGTTTTTTENGNSKTEAETEISEKAVEDAKQSGEAVKVPTEVKAGEDSDSAPTVKVELPKDAGETKIEIPVSDVNSGTVAVIVREDGTEEIVKSSTTTENGLQLKVDGSATIKVIDNSKDFIDTRNHWSREEVNYVVARELFNGIGNNLFGVGHPMTRGMVNTVLARLAGVDTTPKNGQKWYEPGTEWAQANGITDGSNPEASVTREQLAAMLYRFSGTPEVSGSLLFNDAHEISGYAETSLLWAVQNGILNGVGDNRVAPKNNAERAQVAAMMSRYLKNVG